MRSPARKVFHGVFGALVVGALGFGASEAFAVEGSLSDEPYCTYGDYEYCMDGCWENFGRSGSCQFFYGIKMCNCGPP
jgi:hypothetical protein